MPSTVDLRSDTVTRPSPEMLAAMTAAPLGDDVLRDDPTVLKLEEAAAALLGKQAASFVPSGTMANQTAIRALTTHGDEIIADKSCHIFHYESGAPAALSGCGIRFIDSDRGVFTPGDVDAMRRAPAFFYPRSGMVLIENTVNGTVWSVDQVAAVAERARSHGLKVHLDGARLWNACAKSGAAPADYARHADTVSCCFSKGLGAPIGSIVAGDLDTIENARRYKKMFGGAMRQTGLLAAAALYALEHNRDRLADDHANAKHLAEGIATCGPISVDPNLIDTNIVFFEVDPAWGAADQLTRALAEHGILMIAGGPSVRAVTHLDVDADDIERAINAIREVTSTKP